MNVGGWMMNEPRTPFIIQPRASLLPRVRTRIWLGAWWSAGSVSHIRAYGDMAPVVRARRHHIEWFIRVSELVRVTNLSNVILLDLCPLGDV
jgi:hypothetical protein